MDGCRWLYNRRWEDFEPVIEPEPVLVKPKKVFVPLTLEEKRQIVSNYKGKLPEGIRKG